MKENEQKIQSKKTCILHDHKITISSYILLNGPIIGSRPQPNNQVAQQHDVENARRPNVDPDNFRLSQLESENIALLFAVTVADSSRVIDVVGRGGGGRRRAEQRVHPCPLGQLLRGHQQAPAGGEIQQKISSLAYCILQIDLHS